MFIITLGIMWVWGAFVEYAAYERRRQEREYLKRQTVELIGYEKPSQSASVSSL